MVTNQWTKACATWDAFSRREQWLLSATVVALPLALLFVLVIEPALNTLDGMDQKIAMAQQEVESQQVIIRALESAKKPNPDATARQEIEQLANRLNSVQREISEFSDRLLSPSQMLVLLKTVLAQQKDLKVLSAKSLPVTPVFAKQMPSLVTKVNETARRQLPRGIPSNVELTSRAQAASPADVTQKALVYKHAFEIELEGSYQALYLYLRALEALDDGFFFEYLEYTADAYPTGKILLRVHTLSIDEGWIGA
ncbi:MAG: type II secretion system protein GspM [Pontibacterium sp.]